MILQKPALKKVKQAAGHNIQSWAKYNKIPDIQAKDGARSYGTERGTASQLREEKAKEHVKDLENQQRAKQAARQLDKEFFLSVLHSTATKREARSYIKSFTPAEPVTPPAAKPLPSSDHSPRSSCGVNLGGFYRPAAVGQSPTFLQQPAITPKDIVKAQLHVALVKIRAPQTLDDETLNGIGRTLSQLGRLGLVSVVVVDCDTTGPSADAPGPAWKDLQTGQANRIIAAIDGNGNVEARLVDNAIGALLKSEQCGLVLSTAYVTMRKLLMTPLRRGIIPVIPPFGYTDTMQTLVPIPAGDIVVALAKELTGLPSVSLPDEDPKFAKEQLKALRDEVSLDRLIILDPLGGIPATDRPNGYHVFLNMEQEFDPAHQDLIAGLQLERSPNAVQTKAQGPKLTQTTHLDSCNPVSKFTEIEFGSTSSSFVTPTLPDTTKQFPVNWHHLQNLQLTRTVLSMLPPSSSALLTSPEEASNSTKDAPFQAARVGTRRQRNPLIHNLLTDKPVFSSSLPVGRLAQAAMNGSVSPAETITPTTFAKHGMPVTIFPDPKTAPWTSPVPGQPHLNLTDPQIDLPRLIHLIEDSFNRKLDVKDYLNRVNGRLAGVIIAGEYEGGALLTWELPPGVPDDGSPESRARMVPYLDKFAVLKKSQGSGGVADLIFKAMVRDCFPNGCVWRSRKNNPVNKWYFERSRGTWKLPGEGWTMFWTTPELDMDEQLFLDYEGVCRGIQPSWADNKTVLD